LEENRQEVRLMFHHGQSPRNGRQDFQYCSAPTVIAFSSQYLQEEDGSISSILFAEERMR